MGWGGGIENEGGEVRETLRESERERKKRTLKVLLIRPQDQIKRTLAHGI